MHRAAVFCALISCSSPARATSIAQHLHDQTNATPGWNVALITGGFNAGSGGESALWFTAKPGYALPTENTAFRLGSITKTFTGLLLALQNCSGMYTAMYTGGSCGASTPSTKTKLQDVFTTLAPVLGATYTLPGARATITMEQLATHTAGLPKKQTMDICAVEHNYVAVTDCSEIVGTGMGTCLPGECTAGCASNSTGLCTTPTVTCSACTPPGNFEYSNWGINILGHLLTTNAGYDHWWELNNAAVLTPLGMTHTFTDPNLPSGVTQGIGHDCNSTGCSPNIDPFINLDNPAGGLWSTGPDMLKYLKYAMGVTTTSPALTTARNLVFTSHATVAGEPHGLGWASKKLTGATTTRTVWWKDGALAGFHSYIAWTYNGGTPVGAFAITNGGSPDAVKTIVDETLKHYIP